VKIGRYGWFERAYSLGIREAKGRGRYGHSCGYS